MEIQFSTPVYELTPSCFDMTNIGNITIMGTNPYFILHVFPSQEGSFSIMLKDRTADGFG